VTAGNFEIVPISHFDAERVEKTIVHQENGPVVIFFSKIKQPVYCLLSSDRLIL
jgi:hypothetical protein